MEHPQFKNKVSIILTCLGCAVGTGNIWRFPRILANNSRNKGGLAFIILWSIFLFLWSIPMLVIEFAIGRYNNKGVIGSFCRMLSEKFAIFGGWVVMVTFLISCYYSCIVGWCFYYIGRCAYSLPETPQDSRKTFHNFAEVKGYKPVLCTLGACVLVGLIVLKGVRWFEVISSFLVILLLLIIFSFFVASLFMEHASAGLHFVLTPDVDSFGDLTTWVDALSQNAFDTSAGSGLILSFATYLSARHAIVKYAVVIPVLNNLVSLVCALTIFAGVFSTLITSYGYLSKDDIIDIIMDNGPGNTGLTFIWLPVLCNTLGSHVGRTIAVLLFICLSCAGLTTMISNMELFVRTISDFGMKRRWLAVVICMCMMFLISLPSSLNLHILNNQDFVWAFALIINGIIFTAIICLFGLEHFRQGVVNNFTYIDEDWHIRRRPLQIIVVIIFLEGGGLILWWALDLVLNASDKESDWDELGEKTFGVTIIEWLFLVLFVVTCYVMYVHGWRRWRQNRDAAERQGEQQQLHRSQNGGVAGDNVGMASGSYNSIDSGHNSQDSPPKTVVTDVV